MLDRNFILKCVNILKNIYLNLKDFSYIVNSFYLIILIYLFF